MLQVALSVLSHAAFGKPLQWTDSSQQLLGQSLHSSTSTKKTYTFQQSLEILVSTLFPSFIIPRFIRSLIPFGKVHKFHRAFNDFQSYMQEMIAQRNEGSVGMCICVYVCGW